MPEQLIQINNLTYTYANGFSALKGINININKNEFVAIIGQNGSGKSTLLKNLTGLLKPAIGDVLVDGLNTKEVSIAKLSCKVGFVLQNPDRQLFADTVEEEISFGPKNMKFSLQEIKERVEMALEYTGLKDNRDKFPPSLSAGERAKVVIASVVAMRPEIIILDEPTTGQDYRGCYQIMNIAREFHRAGHTVIVVTHNMALVAEYAYRTIVFCKGEVLLDGTAREVFGQPKILQMSYIIPPQITQIGQALEGELKTKKTFLRVDEIRDFISEIYNA
jgi:energy-coupling factor transport system ATP-binding protein